MKVHISLNVKDIDRSVGFYGKMLGSDPVKFIKGNKRSQSDREEDSNSQRELAKTGYAKFDISNPPLNLVLNEVDFSTGGSLSHLGLQVESTKDVLKFKQQWEEKGLITVDEMDVNCCYAKQDKTWVRDPDGNEWEAFVVLQDLESADETNSCDCSDKVSEYVGAVKEEVGASCCDSSEVQIAKTSPGHETCCQSN
ncbi:MAG: glyoxalase/bleomycin resistance/dioxygenase family protein [Pyrinomonadaceae bacterium]|nr:glyoxalase/bleomycin resistance/dioxygenase family protein [Pyrinomonadaceae bacterium]